MQGRVCLRSEDLASEDFLEIGLEVGRTGCAAGQGPGFVSDPLVKRSGEESAEFVEVHFVLLVLVTGMARSGVWQRGGGAGRRTVLCA